MGRFHVFSFVPEPEPDFDEGLDEQLDGEYEDVVPADGDFDEVAEEAFEFEEEEE